jgi:hypothetical protein
MNDENKDDAIEAKKEEEEKTLDAESGDIVDEQIKELMDNHDLGKDDAEQVQELIDEGLDEDEAVEVQEMI